MPIGIRQAYRVTADIAIASSAVLQTLTGLSIPIAAGKIIHLVGHLFFSVGATGGIRFEVVPPAAGAFYKSSLILTNTVAAIPFSVQGVVTPTVFTDAVANAGNHFLDFEVDVENGVNAGNINIQAAQNTSDVLTLTIQRGSFVTAYVMS